MSHLPLPLHPLWFNTGSEAEEIIEDKFVNEEDEDALDSFLLLNHVEAWQKLKDDDPFSRVMFLTGRALAVQRRAKRLAETNNFARYVRHYTYTISWLAALLSDMERIATAMLEKGTSTGASAETTQDAAPSSPTPSTPIHQMRKWEDIVSPTPAEDEHAEAKRGADDDDATETFKVRRTTTTRINPNGTVTASCISEVTY